MIHAFVIGAIQRLGSAVRTIEMHISELSIFSEKWNGLSIPHNTGLMIRKKWQ